MVPTSLLHAPLNTLTIICNKQFDSLCAQAVYNYKGTFMDVECKFPGSIYDTNVFTTSSIWKRLRSSDLLKIFRTISNSELKIPNYLIGDPEYPLLPYCMRQYSLCKVNEEVVSNVMLRSARNPVECAFGRLKVRWQVLTKKKSISNLKRFQI